MNIAILLAAGSGKRMKSDIPKQFLEIDGKMIFKHSLDVFERSAVIDKVVVVTDKDHVSFVEDETKEYGKVQEVIEGGAERYLSVIRGLLYIEENLTCDMVMIHDAARPYIDEEMLARLKEDTEKYSACIAAVPVKDTIKVADKDGFIKETPDRAMLYSAQTPQSFKFSLVLDAYKKLVEKYLSEAKVTDDAQVVEMMTGSKVKLTLGSYSNNKITVPEDLKKTAPL
ncbi:MAG: 2-C-methyl-D-erythritol 4-phosphate cytidylyltransferase [Lachnospiraceae bacterium]|nr:2-C-methyl-D-erythritol 4-phosphate cytidylyltransferase [Lachnospiraceae bacterium]